MYDIQTNEKAEDHLDNVTLGRRDYLALGIPKRRKLRRKGAPLRAPMF